MTIVFASRQLFDQIAGSPPSLGGVALGVPIESVDGRCAVCHPWSRSDLMALEDMKGIEILEELPPDWQYLQNDI